MGGDIVSDGGVLLLRQVDQRIGLTKSIARVFDDRRRRASVAHGMRDLLAQRIYGLCCGWEDVCDHNVLRRDLALQTAVGRADELASAPTLSRLETSSTRAQAAALHGLLLDQFIASKGKRPRELVLDIDATHVPLHGAQEKAHFHRYYDNYCYLPPVRVLRPGYPGLCPASKQPRPGDHPERLDQADHAPPAPSVAARAHHRAGRLRFLPSPSPAALREVGLALHRRLAKERRAAAPRVTG